MRVHSPEEDCTDAALMARIGAGESGAFAHLIERHLGRTVALAGRILGNAADADEVAQEAFLRVWREAGRWRPDGARFTTWLYRVVVNLSIDARRRRRPQVPLDAAAEVADAGRGAFAQAADAEIARHVAAAVAALPPRQRAALALCHYDGLTAVEAGRVMGLGPKAVEALLVRARRTLRLSLAAMKDALLEDLG